MRTSPLRHSGVDHTVLTANITIAQFARGCHDWINSYSTSWWSLLLINRPREDERLSWPCWLTYSGRRGWQLVRRHLATGLVKILVTDKNNARKCWSTHTRRSPLNTVIYQKVFAATKVFTLYINLHVLVNIISEKKLEIHNKSQTVALSAVSLSALSFNGLSIKNTELVDDFTNWQKTIYSQFFNGIQWSPEVISIYEQLPILQTYILLFKAVVTSTIQYIQMQ